MVPLMSATSELSFFQSLAIQGRVLHALMMRELITRFGRDNLGVLWLIGEPMIFTLGVATLWSAAGLAHGGTGIPIVAFAVTGYSSVLMWRNAATRCSAGIEQNKALLFHRSVLIIDVFFDAHRARNHRRHQFVHYSFAFLCLYRLDACAKRSFGRSLPAGSCWLGLARA